MTSTRQTFKLVDGLLEPATSRLVLRPGVSAIAVLDAASTKGEYEIFESFNEAFRFPAYFGWNWDALYDCLSDLSWMPADRYVVVIENAEHLDLTDRGPQVLLVETLQRAARSLSSPMSSPQRRPLEFTVLLFRSVSKGRLVSQLYGLGIDVVT